MTAESADGSAMLDPNRIGEIDLGSPVESAPETGVQTEDAVAPLPPIVEDISSMSLSAELTPGEVTEFFQALDKAVRARRLYAPNNPAYVTFLNSLKNATKTLWDGAYSLSCVVEESGFRWEGQLFSAGEGRENIAFQFFKDGIRLLTLLPGFEEEAERFLDVLARAKQMDTSSADDMVTMLWEQEFQCLQYSYVDALAEGIDVPDTGRMSFEKIELTLVADDAAAPVASSEAPQQPYSAERNMPPVAQSISREDFSETLYFLDEKELEFLQQEVEREWDRDTKGDVLNALFDRLEDPLPKRQTEILRIMRQLLPAFLAGGDLRSASTILIELNGIVNNPEILGPTQKKEAEEIFAELSDPAVLEQLLKSMEKTGSDPLVDRAGTGGWEEQMRIFLRYLRPSALAPLIRATETTRIPDMQDRLRVAIEGLAREHPEVLAELLTTDDEIVVTGAVRLAGQMTSTAAVPGIAGLLNHSLTSIRRAAVESLVQIKSGPALDALQRALEDPERDVRIAAARGLSSLRYQPARKRLEEMLQSKIVRDADLTEKIAFFEAFGAVATAESVAMLDRILNGKKLFGKEPPELRACAAMALGKVGSPASRAALQQAVDDKEPMVRNSVLKALRQESAV